MLVYGDPARVVGARQIVAELRHRAKTLEAAGPPVERHARLAGLFIAAGELAQGLADAASASQGCDGPSAEEDAALALVMALARAVLDSWRALGEGTPAPEIDNAGLLDALSRVGLAPLPAEVRLKTAEGYAFYALYPEAYAAAALQLASCGERRVIGIRSIGSGLAAVMAVALGAGRPVTVRPVGHPFQRHLQLRSDLEANLKASAGGHFVIVDEGPGLSGSSFGAVADTLEGLGVAASRIAFLPGHAGDLGAQASEAHRVRWAAAERPCVSFDVLILHAEALGHRLQSWFADLGGEDATLLDVSGGVWRARRYADEAAWPAANTYQERRKFLLQSPAGTWLLKFAGLGAAGERAFSHAQALASAGFASEACALRHGFLAQPWWADARPMQLRPEDRQAFVRRLGDYLGWRAAHLPAVEDAGASLQALLEMARVNVAESLGVDAAASAAFEEARWVFATPLRRVWTDNRLHAHEWLELGDGRWLKTDGVDHAAAHDLVGAQDIAWDIAGARSEFDLDPSETALLLAIVRERAEVDPDLVALLEPAYLAFQLGAYTMAAQAHCGWAQEQGRLERTAAAYRLRLAARLAVEKR